MGKAKKRRRNGKVITLRTERPVLSGEAKRLINEGRGAEILDSRGKVKKKYINIIRQHK